MLEGRKESRTVKLVKSIFGDEKFQDTVKDDFGVVWPFMASLFKGMLVGALAPFCLITSIKNLVIILDNYDPLPMIGSMLTLVLSVTFVIVLTAEYSVGWPMLLLLAASNVLNYIYFTWQRAQKKHEQENEPE